MAVNNTFKSSDPGPLNKYEYVSFSKVMRLDPITDTWSCVLTVRPDLNQNYTLYGAVPSSVSLKRIKVKNGHLVTSCLSSADQAD